MKGRTTADRGSTNCVSQPIEKKAPLGKSADGACGFRIWAGAVRETEQIMGDTDSRNLINRWEDDDDGWGSMHEGGAQFVMGDGSVQFLSENIDLGVWMNLGNRMDGQSVNF